MPAPTVDDVARIAALPDPVLRNLCITQVYFELSQAMARQTGSGANWCTFATWASKQAGQSIRGEDLGQAFAQRVGNSDEVRLALTVLSEALRRVGARADMQTLRARVLRLVSPDAAFARAADAVARGNVKVFAEIGHVFARYLDASADAPLDADACARFCASLRPGDPPEGQRLLREAFTAYRDACDAPDAQNRAECLFLSNLLVGLHEQTRLQPEIAEALNAALGDRAAMRKQLLAVLLPGYWLRLRHEIARLTGRPLPLDRAIDGLIDALEREMRRVLTATLMTLHLPENTVLRLGHDLRGAFPPELAQPAHPRLRALLGEVDATPDSLRDSGTADWADFGDRMHFIADLFRSRHAWPPLMAAPFTDSQVSALKAGLRPAPPL